MVTLQLIALSIVIISNVLLLSLIPIRKYSRNVSIYFTFSIFTNIIWTVGLLLLLVGRTELIANIGAAMFYIGPLFSALYLLMFVSTFPKTGSLKIANASLLTLPIFSLSILIAFGYLDLIKHLDYVAFPTEISLNTGPFAIYALFFFIYFGAAYVVLINKFLNAKGIERLQVKYLIYAATISSGFASVTNLILPLLGNTNLLWLGPLFTFAYIIIIPVTIAKYRLFDIKAITVKTLSYFASLAILVAILSVIISVFVQQVQIEELSNTNQIITILSFSVLSVIAFIPIKRFIFNISKRLYFSRQITSQELLNNVNDKLVKSSDPLKLLNEMIELLKSSSGSEYLTFYIEPDANIEFHVAGEKNDIFKTNDWDTIADYLKNNEKSYLYSENTDTPKKLIEIMAEHEINLILKMEANSAIVGYMILGERINGEPYFIAEIQILEIIADEIAITLQSLLRFEEIARFNETLQKEVQSATRELKESNEKLKSLDEAKDDFISMASHQLRTPLTSIKGYISMILEGDTGQINEQQKNFLGQAFISSQRMVFLISDLLNVSRLKTGKFVIEKSEVYLPDIVETEIDQLNSTAEARGLKLIYKKPPNYPQLMLDETKTHQVIMNFIDNAIFYSPKGGDINIELKFTGKMASLTVTDNGIGVPKKAQHELFTKFYRAENAKKARPDGTGLGLYMAKKVIIAQGGHIIFKSEENKGSTFGFSFPVNNQS